jgi:DNA-binding MarR family transcriptional regulator
MIHRPIAPPPSLLTVDGSHSATSDRNVSLGASILAQDRIIDREIEHALGSRLEFNILLDLYVSEHQGASPCLWDIGSQTPLPSSTAHRKITGMIDRGLLHRLPPSGDRRRVAVELSAVGKALVEQTLNHLAERNN